MSMAVAPPTAPVQEIEVAAYTIPTDAPEADGTLSWDSTTIVVVHAHAAGQWGLGYTYADVSTAKLIPQCHVDGGDRHRRDAGAAQVPDRADHRLPRGLGRHRAGVADDAGEL